MKSKTDQSESNETLSRRDIVSEAAFATTDEDNRQNYPRHYAIIKKTETIINHSKIHHLNTQ